MPKIIISLMVIAAIYGLMSETKTPQKNQINVEAQRETTSLVSDSELEQMENEIKKYEAIIEREERAEKLSLKLEEAKKKALMTTQETK